MEVCRDNPSRANPLENPLAPKRASGSPYRAALARGLLSKGLCDELAVYLEPLPLGVPSI